jgi:hypothetical protein
VGLVWRKAENHDGDGARSTRRERAFQSCIDLFDNALLQKLE